MEEKIKNVKSRLEFVEQLTSVKDAFRGTHLIEKTENGGWTHPYVHFSGLRFYLILTCFDILGSNDQFLPFPNWLNSSSSKTERETIFSNVPDKELSPLSVEKVYKNYNEIYGITKGFKRFITDVISENDKTLLFENINIRKIQREPQKVLPYEPTENKKINFLFEVRNSFTHTGNPYASPGGGIFDDDGTGVEMDGVMKYGYSTIHIENKKDFYYEYSVRKWPNLLIEILNNTIKTISNNGYKA